MNLLNQSNVKSLTSDEESIIALCTPSGSGAIAILRICGKDVVVVVDKLAKLSSGQKLADLPTHTIHHGHVINLKSGQIIDEVLFFLMRGPKTFTGQDTIEISCHNNSFIIKEVVQQAIACGARQADRGEFTKRAFLNNKVDLVQAESINEIICAQTEQALKKSLSQLKGTLSSCLKKLEEDLVELLAMVEASFEFLEEEQRDVNLENLVKLKTSTLFNFLKKLKTDFNQQKQIREGIKIAIVGDVNVGKSTLFNTILKKNRAIVTDVEGTTRDAVESTLYKDGNFWMVVDTAGLRQTSDVVEQQGVARAWQEAQGADIVLLVWDTTQDLNSKQLDLYRNIIEQHKNKIILVLNKIDKMITNVEDVLEVFPNEVEYIMTSAKNKQGVEKLEDCVQRKIQQMFENLNSPYLLNQRQFNLITQLEQKMKFIVSSIEDDIQYELMACHLKEMLENLSELTGKNVTEKVLDKIFDSFCIGK